MVVGVPVGVQLTALLIGSVMVHVTFPVGISALGTPATVVVRVVTPPKVGLEDATTEMIGV